jgi:hypothetical protein
VCTRWQLTTLHHRLLGGVGALHHDESPADGTEPISSYFWVLFHRCIDDTPRFRQPQNAMPVEGASLPMRVRLPVENRLFGPIIDGEVYCARDCGDPNSS